MLHPINRTVELFAPIYSDGSDGDLIFDGTTTVLGLAPSSTVYTLTRDIYPKNLTVTSVATIKTAGYSIHVKEKLSNAGRISMDGNAASGTTGGTAFTNQGSLNVSAGAGAAGRTTTGAGNAGSGSGGNNVARSSGGAGGQADGGNAGGAGNSSGSPAAVAGDIMDIGFGMRKRLISGTGLLSANSGGGGGSGGASLGTGTASSGAGGGSAGGVLITCLILVNSGIISADGGPGSNGTGTGDAKAGGGGGGSGGYVWIACARCVSEGTIRALGGSPGTGFGGGLSGVVGTAGRVIRLFGR